MGDRFPLKKGYVGRGVYSKNDKFQPVEFEVYDADTLEMYFIYAGERKSRKVYPLLRVNLIAGHVVTGSLFTPGTKFRAGFRRVPIAKTVGVKRARAAPKFVEKTEHKGDVQSTTSSKRARIKDLKKFRDFKNLFEQRHKNFRFVRNDLTTTLGQIVNSRKKDFTRIRKFVNSFGNARASGEHLF